MLIPRYGHYLCIFGLNLNRIQVLLSDQPDFACDNLRASGTFNFNYTFEQYFTLAVPFESVQESPESRSCSTFDYGGATFDLFDAANAYFAEHYAVCSSELGCEPDVLNVTSVACEPKAYNYNDDDGTYTTTTRWDTVCDRSYMQDFDTQTFMVGKLVGAFVFGAMSDSIGRFKTYFISLILQAVCGILVAVSPYFWLYSLSRFLVGATCSGVYLCAYVLALEFIGQVSKVDLTRTIYVNIRF